MIGIDSAALASLCERLTLTLTHSLWQGAAVALAALALGRWITAPRGRHAVYLAALAALAMSVVLTFALVQPITGPTLARGNAPAAALVPTGRAAGAVAPAAAPDLHTTTSTPPADTETGGATSAAATPWLTRLAPAVAGLYFVGVAVMGVRLMRTIAAGQRLRRDALSEAPPAIIEALARRAAAMRLGVPRIACSLRVAAPCVVGLLRPMILVPTALAAGFSPAQVEAMLAHELAHLARRDPSVELLQRVIETALFFHPAVWWLSARVRMEREHCCDDAAAAALGDRRSYAGALVQIAAACRAVAAAPSFADAPLLAMAGRSSALRARVARLLAGHGGAEEPARLSNRGAAALAVAVGVAVGGAILFSCGPSEPPAPPQRAASTASGAGAATQPPELHQPATVIGEAPVARLPLPENAAAPTAEDLAANPERPLEAGDLVQIDIDDLMQPGVVSATRQRIDADGMVQLPVLGLVPAAGRTAPALMKELARMLVDKAILRSPSVRVVLASSPAEQFSVVADEPALASVGQYPLTAGVRMLDVLALAKVQPVGGSVYVIRRSGERARVIEVPFAKLLAGDPSVNITIRPRDVVRVVGARG